MRMPPDPFGRAIRDHYHDEREEPLIDRDGDQVREHKIEEWYFGDHREDAWWDAWIQGPLIDLGAGAGRDALYYQEHFETVAIDISQHLIEVMRDRGVRDARRLDMFDLRGHIDRDRFNSALAVGKQIGLVQSIGGLRQFLGDLAHVTRNDATAVIDNYAPELEATEEVFAYRNDPSPGLAYRVYHEEYEGEVGETLLFRLFSVERLREVALGTPWTVTDVEYGDVDWRAVLEKGL